MNIASVVDLSALKLNIINKLLETLDFKFIIKNFLIENDKEDVRKNMSYVVEILYGTNPNLFKTIIENIINSNVLKSFGIQSKEFIDLFVRLVKIHK